MPRGEFSLIDQYFRIPAARKYDKSIALGIGDDAAILQIPDNRLLVQTIDTLISGRHFPTSTSAEDIAYKSLAVNVSDLAAMAATPWSFVMSLTLPEVNDEFLSAFSSGLFKAADEFGIQLVGGDTCRGPLSITIQASGHVDKDHYVTRQGARVGDHIMVSGQLGSAALGLSSALSKCELDKEVQLGCLQALNRPSPRIDLIECLAKYASSAIDVSDGLVSDLGHILECSKVGAEINKSSIPVLDWIKQNNQYQYALSGGDDYQIVFTVHEQHYDQFLCEVFEQNMDVSEIGVITRQGYVMQDEQQSVDLSQLQGFNHFAE